MDNQNKYKIIALFGESASGKDTLLNRMCKSFNVNKIISYTTRPQREHEVDGINYHFVNETEMLQLLLDEKLLEAQVFNNWVYATSLDSLSKDKINIGVWAPEGVRNLLENQWLEVCPIYCLCPTKERIIRSLLREDEPDIDEIFRRYKTDIEDFSYIDFDYVTLNTLNKPTDSQIKQASIFPLEYNQM